MQVGDWAVIKEHYYQPFEWRYLGQIVYAHNSSYLLRVPDFEFEFSRLEKDLLPINQISQDEIAIFLSQLTGPSAHQLAELIKNASR